MRSPNRSARFATRLLYASLLLAAAAPAAAAPDHAFVQLGAGEHAGAVTAGVTMPWTWQRDFGGGTLTGLWEFALGRWRGEHSGGTAAWSTQVGVTPALRWSPGGSRWFVEGGIGLNLITPRYRRDDDTFSTRFNFGDHLAIGRRVGDAGSTEVSLRAQHFSNAGIKKPNPGEQFLQLRVSWKF